MFARKRSHDDAQTLHPQQVALADWSMEELGAYYGVQEEETTNQICHVVHPKDRASGPPDPRFTSTPLSYMRIGEGPALGRTGVAAMETSAGETGVVFADPTHSEVAGLGVGVGVPRTVTFHCLVGGSILFCDSDDDLDDDDEDDGEDEVEDEEDGEDDAQHGGDSFLVAADTNGLDPNNNDNGMQDMHNALLLSSASMVTINLTESGAGHMEATTEGQPLPSAVYSACDTRRPIEVHQHTSNIKELKSGDYRTTGEQSWEFFQARKRCCRRLEF